MATSATRTPNPERFAVLSIDLDAAPPTSDAHVANDPGAPRWRQVAYEGEWKGHRAGKFTLTRADLGQIVANFRRSRSYRPGAAAASRADIDAGKFYCLAWDNRHISEMHPGVASVEEQAAVGWAMEMDVRDGSDGRAQLWAFTQFLEPVATLVAEKKIRWASIHAMSHVKDTVSAADLGWVVTSIAVTNRPFLDGMVPLELGLSLSLEGQRLAAQGFDCEYGPDGPEECVACLRELFGLPTNAELGAVLGELAKLKSWSSGAASAPAGVDVRRQVGSIRRMLNLRTNATPAEVFTEADRLLADLAAVLPPTPPQGATSMSFSAAFLALLKRHNITVGPDDEPGAIVALEGHLQQGSAAVVDRDTLLRALAPPPTPGVALTFGAPAPALPTVAQAGERLAELGRRAGLYDAIVPRLTAWELEQVGAEELAAATDVVQVARDYKFPETSRYALEMARTGGVRAPAATATSEERAAFLKVRAGHRTTFLAQYKPLDPNTRALTTDYVGGGSTEEQRRALETVAARNGGAAPAFSIIGAGGAPISITPHVGIGGALGTPPPPTGPNSQTVALSEQILAYGAPNMFMGAMAWVRANDKTGDWTNPGNHTALCKRAKDLLVTNRIDH